MPTDNDIPSNEQPMPVDAPLSLRELATVLVRHYGLHEGRYDLMIEFQIGVGAIGPDPSAPSPGAMIGVSKVGLMPSKNEGSATVDAAVVNPAKKPRTRANTQRT